jgi:exonuclease III
MKLIQLNVEGDAHLPLVKEFLTLEEPDVICLQEVFKKDLDSISPLRHTSFLPMLLERQSDGSLDERGIAICSRFEQTNHTRYYYHKPQEILLEQDKTNQETKRQTIQHGVLRTTIDGISFASIHHTWTQHGHMPSDYQKKDTRVLMKYLQTIAPTIICGDFNIPRGYNECYNDLTAYLVDCVPDSIASSMYIPLHRVRTNPVVAAEVARYMVDYIFRTPKSPNVSGVTSKCGMSDHCALIATIG